MIRQFRIKICGVTSVADALAALDAGADALGLNFHPLSPRCVDPLRGAEIAAAIGDRAAKVGVFVNRTASEIVESAGRCGLDAAQLHGDESPTALAALAALPLIKAFRPGGSLAPVAAFLGACRELGALPGMTLIDAAAPGLYGGSGHIADWAPLGRRDGLLAQVPLILAGGLTPDNVLAAIETARPEAVDVASGVEQAPGRKSRAKMFDFVAAARAGFDRLEGR